MNWQEVLSLVRFIFYDQTLFRIKDVKITLNHLFVAGATVLIAIFISRVVRSILKKRFFPRFKIEPGLEFAFLRITHYAILVLGVYVGLASLNFPLEALVGFVALLGVGIGFGLQNLASNFISGIILLFDRPIKIGDRITVDDIWGDVVQIKLRSTIVNTPDNISIIIPNSKLLEHNLINWDYGDHRIRIHVSVGVAYGSDVNLVTKLLIQAANEHNQVLDTPEPEVWFNEFGDSSLNFELVCWIPNSTIKPAIVNELNRAIDKLFRENKVEIPFPQRDLHIRSGLPKISDQSDCEKG